MIESDAASSTSWRSAPLDAIVIVTLLASVNWFVSREDLGWFNLNPSPWVLLPLFLGGRYGVIPGLIGSGLAASVILSLNRFSSGADPIELLSQQPYFFLAVLLIGSISSLIHSLVAGPVRQIINRNRFLEKQSDQLTQNLSLYRENEAALQQSLLLHGAETASLTGELHRLFTHQTENTETGLLDIYQRLNGVEAAAIYRRGQASKPFKRVASLGDSSDESLYPTGLNADADENPLFHLALEKRQLTTCRHLWDKIESNDTAEKSGPFIAAIPSSNGNDLLVISRMSFEHVNWDSFTRVETMFNWVMAHRDDFTDQPADANVTATGSSAILSPADFATRLRLAQTAAGKLGLQSRLILFTPAPHATAESQTGFIEALQASTDMADTIGAIQTVEGSSYAIALLAPLVSEAAAKSRAERILSAMPAGNDSIRYRVVDPANKSTMTELGFGSESASTPMNFTPEPQPTSAPETVLNS